MNERLRYYRKRLEDVFLWIKYADDLSLRTTLVFGGIFLIASAWTLGGLFSARDAGSSVAVTGALDFVPYAEPGSKGQGAEVPALDSGAFVASRTGSVYYAKSCKGWARIGKKNQVWFDTEDAAKGSGYLRAKGCK